MYVVIEIQTNADGSIGTLFYQFDSINSAMAKYYSILSIAAVSELPVYSAAIITNAGNLIESKFFTHEDEENVSGIKSAHA